MQILALCYGNVPPGYFAKFAVMECDSLQKNKPNIAIY